MRAGEVSACTNAGTRADAPPQIVCDPVDLVSRLDHRPWHTLAPRHAGNAPSKRSFGHASWSDAAITRATLACLKASASRVGGTDGMLVMAMRSQQRGAVPPA
jgi:hypothetical protein